MNGKCVNHLEVGCRVWAEYGLHEHGHDKVSVPAKTGGTVVSTRQEFRANEEKYEAVNRKFEIIGEAARRLSPAALKTFPEIPWKLITAMRNILIHDCDDVGLDIVWDTAQRDLPPLIARLDSYLAANPPRES